MTSSNNGRSGLSAPTRRSVLLGATAAAIAPAGRALAQSRSAKKIRYAHSAPLTHGWHLWGVQFKTLLEKMTNGTMQVTIFPNAQMGTERDIAQAVRLNSLEMGGVGVALMNWVPEMSVTDAPFLFKNRNQAYAALDGELGAELKRRSMAQGFRIAGWHDLGMRCMTNSKHPIHQAKDMGDLKMRVPDSKSYTAMMQAMGSTVVAVDLSELYLALSQGVADGQDTPPSVVKSNKYYEVQKFAAKTEHVMTNSYAIINPQFFDGLSKDEQAAVASAGDEATVWLREYTQKDELEAYEFLKTKGMTVDMTPDIASFQAATAEVITKLPDLFYPDLVTLARSAAA
jgi:tripartite ATP-independent transporter DctP family solute receptor